MNNYITRKRIIGHPPEQLRNVIRYASKLLAINFSDRNAVKNCGHPVEREAHLLEKDWFLGHSRLIIASAPAPTTGLSPR